MNKQVVFISGCHKSGSSLLRSLFYNHTEVNVVPIETHFLKILGHYTINPYHTQSPSEISHLKFKNKVLEHVNKYINSTSNLSDAKILTGNIHGFKKSFQPQESDGIDELGLKYFISCIKEFTTQNYKPSNTIVEKSVTNSEFAIEFSKIFPEAKFLHILRNPYANLAALRKYNTTTQKGPFLMRLLELLRNDYYFMYKNENLLQDNYRIVLYEDLLSNPKEIMQNLSAFIGIPFEKELLIPQNSLGDTWKGNSTTGEEYTNINSNKIDDFKSYIHPLEVQLINKHFSFVLNDFKYETLESSGTILKPFPKESISRYIVNRLTSKLIHHWSN